MNDDKNNNGNKYFTVREVAEILKVTERTIYNLIESGELKAVKVGDLWRIPESSLPKVK